MELTTMGNADIWRAELEEWLWGWENSFRADCPPYHPHPRETQPKENLFCERNIYPSHFHTEEVELELQLPRYSQPSLRQELSLLWEMNSAAGMEQDAVNHPRYLEVNCALWMHSQLIHERYSPGHTKSLQGGQQSLCGSPVTEWVTFQGNNLIEHLHDFIRYKLYPAI